MACSLHLLIQVQPLPNFPSITAPLFPQKPFHIPSLTSLKPSNKPLFSKPLTVPFALTESSESPNSLQPNNSAQSLLQHFSTSIISNTPHFCFHFRFFFFKFGAIYFVINLILLNCYCFSLLGLCRIALIFRKTIFHSFQVIFV